MSYTMYTHMYSPPPIEQSKHRKRLGIKRWSELSQEEREPYINASRPNVAYDLAVQELLNADPEYQAESLRWREAKRDKLLSESNGQAHYVNEFIKLLSEYKKDPCVPNEIIFTSWLRELVALTSL